MRCHVLELGPGKRRTRRSGDARVAGRHMPLTANIRRPYEEDSRRNREAGNARSRGGVHGRVDKDVARARGLRKMIAMKVKR